MVGAGAVVVVVVGAAVVGVVLEGGDVGGGDQFVVGLAPTDPRLLPPDPTRALELVGTIVVGTTAGLGDTAEARLASSASSCCCVARSPVNSCSCDAVLEPCAAGVSAATPTAAAVRLPATMTPTVHE